MVQQDTRSVSVCVYEFEQLYECNYYYELEENTVRRFVKGFDLHIQERMPAYTIDTLQHAILVAKQIELLIVLQIRREKSQPLK